MRYEILEGSLLVSPVPRNRHGRVMGRVLELLRSQAPQDAFVSAFGIGIQIRGGRTYFIPDVLVVRDDGPDDDALGVEPADVLLVVEVLSPSNARTDLIFKRHEYAVEKIPAYWIVDPESRTLTVLEHDGKEHYTEVATVKPGETFTTDRPFPISFDLAEIF